MLSAAHSGKIQRFCQYLTWTSKHKNGSLQNLRALGLQHNTRNISLTTEDGIKLNGYHIIPSKHAPEVNSIHLKEIGDKSNRRTSLDRFFSNELIKTKTGACAKWKHGSVKLSYNPSVNSTLICKMIYLLLLLIF